MTNLKCSVAGCANQKNDCCCRPDIMIGGPAAKEKSQTYCANFLDQNGSAPENAVDHSTENPTLDVHCNVTICEYYQDRSCTADHVDISTNRTSNGSIKTQCSTFRMKA